MRDEEQRTADRLKQFEKDWGKKDRRAEGSFDTRFFKGVCKDRDYYHVEGMDKIYADNEINYLGIGMYESWLGDSKLKADIITWLWKQQYPGPIPSGTWYWLHRGYDDYPNMGSGGSSGGSSGSSGGRR